MIGIPWGVSGVIAAGAVASALMGGLAVWLVRSQVDVTMGAWLRALLPACLATGFMAGGILLTRLILSDHVALSRLGHLAALVIVGSVCYVVPLLPWISRERRRYRVVPETRTL